MYNSECNDAVNDVFRLRIKPSLRLFIEQSVTGYSNGIIPLRNLEERFQESEIGVQLALLELDRRTGKYGMPDFIYHYMDVESVVERLDLTGLLLTVIADFNGFSAAITKDNRDIGYLPGSIWEKLLGPANLNCY